MVSLLDTLLSHRDWVVFDAECHACIIDGLRLKRGKSRSFRHNDVEQLEEELTRIERERADDDQSLHRTMGEFTGWDSGINLL